MRTSVSDRFDSPRSCESGKWVGRSDSRAPIAVRLQEQLGQEIGSNEDILVRPSRSALSHPNAIDAPAIVTLTNRKLLVSRLSIKVASVFIRSFDHQHHIPDRQTSFQGFEQSSSNSAVLPVGIDTNVDDSGITPLLVANRATDDAITQRGDDKLFSWQQPQEKQRTEPIGQPGLERAPLQACHCPQVPKCDRSYRGIVCYTSRCAGLCW